MATAIAPASAPCISVEDYLRGEYEPDAEYVEGTIEERSMGQYEHAAWQRAILLWFARYEQEWNVRCLPEYRVRVDETIYRVPDVTVWDRALPREQVLTHAPIAVFEVLSPEDRVPRLLRKLEDYRTMGVRTIVVIHPETDTIYRYEDGALVPNEGPECPGSACRLDWRRIRELCD